MNSMSDRRQSARVETDIPCTLDRSDARLRNFSLGGALVLGPPGLGELEEAVSLQFRVGRAPALMVFGKILRLIPREEDTEYGIQFLGVQPHLHQELARCIVLLVSGKGAGTRGSARLYRRAGLWCRNAEEFAATLKDISRGGLGLECDVPLFEGEPLVVEIKVEPLEAKLELSGIIRNVRAERDGQYRVGVRFETLAPEQKERLDALLQWMSQAGARWAQGAELLKSLASAGERRAGGVKAAQAVDAPPRRRRR